jgi:hypothetical protein
MPKITNEIIAFERVLHAVRGLTPDRRQDVLKRATAALEGSAD